MERPQERLEESAARRREIAQQIAVLTREWDDLLAEELQIRVELAREEAA